MVIWIIGLSGAGKSTLAEHVMRGLKQRDIYNVVNLDGDLIREAFGNDLGHNLQDRKLNAKRISAFSKLLNDQGIHVISPILSLFQENRDWNRENIGSYFEVFIDAPLEQLIQRDAKGIYKKYQTGELKNVAGLDLNFDKPVCSDLIVDNSGSKSDLISVVDHLVDLVCQNTSK